MIRYKKIAMFKVLDVWFDNSFFYESKNKLAILHTNDVIDKKEYDFSFLTYTLLLDITASEEELYKKMNRGCRGRINRSTKAGINVYKTTDSSEIDEFNRFQKEFCSKKEIPIVDREELDDMDVYIARDAEGTFLGGSAYIISEDKKTVRYKYGATSHESNANEMLLWKAICDYHNEGFALFDFGGCNPTDDETSYYYKNYMFKKKFGGELAESYLYYRTKGIFKLFYYVFAAFVSVFFKGNINDCVMWLNKFKLIK